MSRRPEHDPPGAKPVLPPPLGPGADRARRVFEGYVKRMREGASLEELAAAGPVDPGPPPAPASVEPAFGPPPASTGGRQYTLALSKVVGGDEAEPAAVDSAAAAVAPMPLAEQVIPPRARPDRPPPGAPTVRPAVQRKSDPGAVSQDLLEGTADTAMLVANPDGTTSFDIAFNDDVFPNLACRITIADGKVVATFRVEDQNLRRLLEAEAGRLRASLEDRGLKVAEVRVEVG
jgi:hypothetical protein